MSDAGGNASWVPYGFALLQTGIVAVLGYISTLLRDIRTELAKLKNEVTRHDVQLEEAEKRDQMRAHETERRLDHLERSR